MIASISEPFLEWLMEWEFRFRDPKMEEAFINEKRMPRSILQPSNTNSAPSTLHPKPDAPNPGLKAFNPQALTMKSQSKNIAPKPEIPQP